MTRRRMLAVAAGLVVVATAVLGSLSGTASAQTQPTAGELSTAAGARGGGSIVVIGTGGLSWGDVSAQTTPAVWSLLRDGGTATMTVHSVHANTCPVDGWLTLSAGEQAADTDGARGDVRQTGTGVGKPPCQALPESMTAGTVPQWGSYLAAAAATRFDATLGLLGDQIAKHGVCVQAVGPGAALAAARSNGTVDHYQKFDGATLPAALATCPATLVDVGAVRDPADVDPLDQVAPTTTRAQQVAAIDSRVAAVLKAAPAGTDVVVASLADAGVTAGLRMVAAAGPHFGTGTLESASTRQQGLVQITDLTPTVLERLGIPRPSSLGGTPLGLVPAKGNSEASAVDRHEALLDYDNAAREVKPLVEPFFYGWGLLQLALYLGAAVLWRRGWGTPGQRRLLLRGTRAVAVFAATIPVSTFLANLLPWWRFPIPLVAVSAAVLVFAALISALALWGPWRERLFGPLLVVCTATMVVLALDVMTGSRLQLSSLMGLQPVIGGRFYGMGNVTFALFGTATLLLCTAVASHYVAARRPRVAALAVASIGLVAVIVDGSPWWGSDFGGPPALLPGVVLLILAVLHIKVTWPRLMAIGGGTVGLLVILGLLDWLRPAESRSHLGRFVQTTLDGGAWDIVVRKLEQNITLLLDNPLSLLIPFLLLLFGYLLARPGSSVAKPFHRSFERIPLLRRGLIAVLVMWVIGFALNDSGSAIPAVGGTLALPLVIAIGLRTLEKDRAAEPMVSRAARSLR